MVTVTAPRASLDRRYVSPVEVSRALGVSETTVKRWVDSGRLPAHKTPGGHRRILVSDVLTLVSQENWPHVDLALLQGSCCSPVVLDTVALQQQLYETLLVGDTERARTVVFNTHQAGLTVPRLADEVVSPVLARVGHGWAESCLDVYHEHRATQVCLAALQALKAHLEASGEPPADRPLAIGGGPEFDHYLLANLLVELTFRELGWRAIQIGPNTPFASFVRAMDELKPRLLWLSCSHLASTEEFLTGYQTLSAEAARLGFCCALAGER